MVSTFKDYYKILGVSKEATSDEISKSFRKLSRKYHPDINKEVGSEEKYKEITEAYDVLSDKVKKQDYDLKYDYLYHKNRLSYTKYNSNKKTSSQRMPFISEDDIKKVWIKIMRGQTIDVLKEAYELLKGINEFKESLYLKKYSHFDYNKMVDNFSMTNKQICESLNKLYNFFDRYNLEYEKDIIKNVLFLLEESNKFPSYKKVFYLSKKNEIKTNLNSIKIKFFKNTKHNKYTLSQKVTMDIGIFGISVSFLTLGQLFNNDSEGADLDYKVNYVNDNLILDKTFYIKK